MIGYLDPPTGNYVSTHRMIYSPRYGRHYAFHFACLGHRSLAYATIGDSAADREPDHVIIGFRQLSNLKKFIKVLTFHVATGIFTFATLSPPVIGESKAASRHLGTKIESWCM